MSAIWDCRVGRGSWAGSCQWAVWQKEAFAVKLVQSVLQVYGYRLTFFLSPEKKRSTTEVNEPCGSLLTQDTLIKLLTQWTRDRLTLNFASKIPLKSLSYLSALEATGWEGRRKADTTYLKDNTIVSVRVCYMSSQVHLLISIKLTS